MRQDTQPAVLDPAPPDGASARRRLASPERLAAFFRPGRIALVGASDGSGWARFIVDSLRVSGFAGDLRVVHPKRPSAFGMPTAKSLCALGEPVDLAFVLAPTHAVDEVLDDAAAAGVRNVIVLAAGYGDGGGEQGRERERRLVEKAIELDITLLGPNCLGFVNAAGSVAPFGLAIVPPLRRGPVGVVLQSGALTSTVLAFARAHGIGISLLTSMGNEAVITTADVIEYLVGDPDTEVVGLFLESIRDAPRFVELASRALAVGKPIVALKVGRTPVGQRTALAHTGAVAGDHAVVSAAFRQYGVLGVDSLEQLLVTAGLLASGPLPAGPRMGVVTASGGACDIIADRAPDEGLDVVELSDATTTRLREVLPPFASARNPLDVTGIILADRQTAEANLGDVALNAVVADPNVDFVLNMVSLPAAEPPDPTLVQRRIAAVAATRDRSPVPIVNFIPTCSDLSPFALGLLDRHRLHALAGIEFGLTALGHALSWQDARRRARPVAVPVPSPWTAGPMPESPWSEARARELVAAAGVPVVPAELVTEVESAVAAAGRLGWPAVLKICAPEITHKSDVGGVALDLAGPDAVRAAFPRVLAVGRSLASSGPATPEGVLVSPMRRSGLELFAGVHVDPSFGPVLAVGLGGIFVEVLRDVALRVLPVDAAEVRRMLAELRGAPLLAGARGTEPVDLDRLAEVIVGLTEAARSLGPALRTVEINPLRVAGSEIEALDVLVVTGQPDH